MTRHYFTCVLQPFPDTTVRDGRRPALCTVGAVLLLGVLGGCTGAEAALEPELTWVQGKPQGPLESDEWVQSVRAGEFAYAWAANVADFSLPALATTWDEASIGSFVSNVQSDLLFQAPHVYVGPRGLVPLAVQVSDDGRSAEVATCVAARDVRPARDDGNRWPDARIYSVQLGEDGHRRITRIGPPRSPYLLPDGTEVTSEYCDGLTIPRAVFRPEPDLQALSKKGRDDVVLPTPSSSQQP